MILTELIPEETYLIDVGFGFKYKMKFLRKVGNKQYRFVVQEHFMDSNHDNWEIGHIWPVLNWDDIHEIHPDIPSNTRKELMGMLGNIWNQFLELTHEKYQQPHPGGNTGCLDLIGMNSTVTKKKVICNPNDITDFKDAIHTCQRILATQELKHIQPEFFS